MIVHREVVGGFFWSAVPLRVVEDSGTSAALYWARGTTCWWSSHAKGEHRVPRKVTQRAEPWFDMGALLTVVELGAWYSVSLMWDTDGRFVRWYVDFIRPYVRTSCGLDFTDVHLDQLVEADGTARVKDADEFDEAAAAGELSDAEVRRIRDECAQLEPRAAADREPFDSKFISWTPGLGWTVPTLRSERAGSLESSPTPAWPAGPVSAWSNAT